MRLASQTEESIRPEEMSPAISAAMVDSLFDTHDLLLAGLFFTVFAAVLTALKTGSHLIWACVALFVVTATVRLVTLRQYRAHKTSGSPDENSPWKTRHLIGATMHAAALGIWCSVALLATDDAVAHVISFAVATGIMAGAAGRAYGRPWVYQLQAVLVLVPLALALAVYGSPYYIALSIMSIAFLVSLLRISANLHRIFMQAVVSRERARTLAGRFDTALNNMPQGLCMFRLDGRLAVMNHRFRELMNLSGNAAPTGTSAPDVIAACVGAGSLPASSGQTLLAEIANSQAKNFVTTDPDEERNRSLSWTVQPMDEGGAVVLLEDITERRAAEARISHLARYDDLTELPNRVTFREEIERRLANNQDAKHLSALLFIDLDHFKQVNDTLGHHRGDMLLCAVASRLHEMLRAEDFIARFGGDEFVVFLESINSAPEAAALARRIVDRLSERYRIDDHMVEIRASIGIALTTPEAPSFDTLLKNADMAVYKAKADGRGGYCFFRDEMAASADARRILELDLRKALAEEELEVFFQPLVNLKSGKISTCEALLRWNHPERGAISPADIIPVAEEMGMIMDLGRWILRRACMECVNWPKDVRVAVNFSPRQFHEREVLTEVCNALDVSGLPPNRLEIEITESSLLNNTQEIHDLLLQLKELGVRISLDDFGTGYSSLSYLHNFPLQKVKIDRSFLDGIETDRPLRLLRGVARLSADLGMSVVVEGIETNEQLELVSADGTVTEGQGYLFSPAVPPLRIRELLDASHGRRASKGQLVKAP